MNATLRSMMALAGMGLAAPALAQVTLYEHDGFQGRSFTTQKQVADFQRLGFNDRASSVIVTAERWEACDDLRFRGRCVVLRPGQYPSLAAMGLDDRVSSMRMVARNAHVEEGRYAPAPVVTRDYRRRKDERLFEAEVTSVRAVVAPGTQRCWIEREHVAQDSGAYNMPGAVIGAVLGGVLGHQIGSGRGNDLATAGGAVAGGVVGANVGRNGGSRTAYGQDVQRCENVPSQARPEYWDVTYSFRGQDHQVQMNKPPGRTVTVNRHGEPRA
jgi:uncharacterized protein YcfJ